MNRRKKQSGFVLMYAIVLMVLVGLGITIVTKHSFLLGLQTRQEILQSEAGNLLLSAQSWAEYHTSKLLSAAEGEVFDLETQDPDLPGSRCAITVISRTNESCKIRIESTVRSGGKSATQKQILLLSAE